MSRAFGRSLPSGMLLFRHLSTKPPPPPLTPLRERRKPVFRRSLTLPIKHSVPFDYPNTDEEFPSPTPAPQVIPPGHRAVTQRVTVASITLFTRTMIVQDRRSRTAKPVTASEKAEQEKYELSRLAWLDLVEAAPSGSVAHGLQLIAAPLYELVGEVGGKGMGKTFSDNKTLFYSAATLANVVAWAKYETFTIGNASYTSCFTKLAGMAISEAGRAWLLWLCHSAEAGHTKADDYVLQMNKHHPWNELGILERTGIRAVAKLNSKVLAVVPPDPSYTREEL